MLLNSDYKYSLIICSQCWEQLVWLDPANYAGIQGKLPAGLQIEAGDSQNIETMQISENDNDENSEEVE